MKKILLILLAVVSSITANAQEIEGTKALLDQKNGFKTINLNSDISTLKGKVTFLDGNTKPDKDDCIYYDVTDKSLLKIGDQVTLKNITIRAFKGKILNIILMSDNSTGSTIYDIFTKAYGRYSERPNRFMDKYYWYGQKVKLMLNFDSSQSQVMIFFTSIELDDIFNKEQEERSKKSASDL